MWQIVLKKLSAAKLRELNIFAFADKNTLRKSKGIFVWNALCFKK